MHRFYTLILIGLVWVACPMRTWAQSGKIHLTLNQAIEQAQSQSVDAMAATYSFLSSYWQFRAYKANFLPALSLSGTLPSFDRSITKLQDPNTGEYKYLQNYAMTNTLGLNLKQNIALTGGSISLFTGLTRLDQFGPTRNISYNSSPVSLILNQPIGAFNRLRWDKKIEPMRYEQAKFAYLEAMSDIVNHAVSYFFDLLISGRNLKLLVENRANTESLYRISEQRFRQGMITRSELLQLELRLLNEGIAINKGQLNLNMAQARLRSYLGYKEGVELVADVPTELPELTIDLERAYRLSQENTSISYRQRVQTLEAESAVSEAKANRRPNLNLYARFGLNQVASEFGNAYHNPMDQETVQLGVSVPIFDGGVAKGRLKMAIARKDVVEAQIEKESIDQRENLYLKVMQFNTQGDQCRISFRADTVASERYRLAMTQFAEGKLSVMELNNAQTERNDAGNRLVAELHSFWSYYYAIRRLTLYDFLTQSNISADFDKITD